MIFCIAANDTSSRRQLCELLSVGDASLLLARALLLLRSFTASALTISGTDDCRVRPPLGVGVDRGGGSASLKMDSMSEAHVSDVCNMALSRNPQQHRRVGVHEQRTQRPPTGPHTPQGPPGLRHQHRPAEHKSHSRAQMARLKNTGVTLSSRSIVTRGRQIVTVPLIGTGTGTPTGRPPGSAGPLCSLAGHDTRAPDPTSDPGQGQAATRS